MMNKKTVDSVLKVFTKCIDELNEVAKRNYADLEKNSNKVKKLELESEGFNTEMERANRLSIKIIALLE